MGKPSGQIYFIFYVHLATMLLGTSEAVERIKLMNGSQPANVPRAISCGEQMECMQRYLCGDNNTVIKDGRGILNFRTTSFSRIGNHGCGWEQKCCAITYKKPNNAKELEEEYVPRGCGYTNPKGIKLTHHNAPNGESQFGEFPWMLNITVKSCNSQQCVYASAGGGSLLTPKVALTAAHIIFIFNERDIKVKAGEWDTRGTDAILESQQRQVKKKILHESFNEITGSFDIALLILETQFKLAPHIGTICLPSANQKFEHSRCIVTGWGKRPADDQDFPNILKKIDLPIVKNYVCQYQLQNTRLGHYFELHNSFICAGGEKDIDACLGDGGGPLACPLSNYPDRYQLAGIVSWGVECGLENVPGVYANIAMLRHWIDEKLQSN